MAHRWFETVAVAQERAKRRLPSSVYKALLAGSEKGTTYADNTAAFAELGFAPHVVGSTPERSLATSFLGQPAAMPVMISPTGVQAVHPDGEVAVARAAAARGIPMGLSSFASKPIEEVAAANSQTFFQMYWMGSREQMARRMARAREAGAVGLIATTDWSFSNGRDWGSPIIPQSMDLKTIVTRSPEALMRPKWFLEFARTGRPPQLQAPNLNEPGQPAPGFFEAYYEWMQTPPPTWEDIAWMKQEWGGTFLLKGVCRVDDALRAVDAGVDGISVSNHGGNNLDGTPASIRCLPAVADAVGDQIDVLLDGGVRRGSDVAKAVALGAKAVLIGRAYLWGLAAGGQPGVENVLDVLNGGLDSALRGLGKASVQDLAPSDVLVPDGFTRALGVPAVIQEAPAQVEHRVAQAVAAG
ncbi:pre-mycofactocin synthase MftD [Branchiibius sp. NY16-3462-2]|uniref:pre-mycofactocin synthase MftD n=1 Tax=Branchiibius sp. NY16-3462-2 TaxID=1807500 RepID=UPI000791DD7D|nr:pre-mycofactocin synthase MftD [Branchiibius sp. NY16-3462-2]KYH46104.1 alpha-hydroxy-acid oxidizing enzyme [Branchiibius sp. NY16-3462-2]